MKYVFHWRLQKYSETYSRDTVSLPAILGSIFRPELSIAISFAWPGALWKYNVTNTAIVTKIRRVDRDETPCSSWCVKPIGTWLSVKNHDDVIKWKHFPRYWLFVRGIQRSPVNYSHYGQWRGVLMFSLICARINGWVNNGEAGDLRRHHAHYDAIVMLGKIFTGPTFKLLMSLISDIYRSLIPDKNTFTKYCISQGISKFTGALKSTTWYISRVWRT